MTSGSQRQQTESSRVVPLTLPSPVLPRVEDVPSLRWGIVGTGVARAFVGALTRRSNQRVVAVTARDRAKTQAFASEFGIDVVHDSVDALVNDPAIDVVYIATPHPLHREQALSAIAAGKHVLIEKPIAVSAAEAREITQAGASAGVLVMEAMWTRYLPQADVIRRIIADGLIGDVHTVTADFGFVSAFDASNRLWAPELGGGALLDAGVYPVSFASSVLGSPSRIYAEGDIHPNGVDTRADMLLVTATGRALLSTALTTQLPTRAAISGSEGSITVGTPFFGSSAVTVNRGSGWDGERGVFDDPGLAASGDGIGLQATALASYVRDGRLESPLHTHAEVIEIMTTLDTVRQMIRA
jgi:predicted dehydrogenase